MTICCQSTPLISSQRSKGCGLPTMSRNPHRPVNYRHSSVTSDMLPMIRHCISPCTVQCVTVLTYSHSLGNLFHSIMERSYLYSLNTSVIRTNPLWRGLHRTQREHPTKLCSKAGCIGNVYKSQQRLLSDFTLSERLHHANKSV